MISKGQETVRTTATAEAGLGITAREEQDAYCSRLDFCERGFAMLVRHGLVADPGHQRRGSAANRSGAFPRGGPCPRKGPVCKESGMGISHHRADRNAIGQGRQPSRRRKRPDRCDNARHGCERHVENRQELLVPASADDVEKLLYEALKADFGLFTLVDEKGRKVFIPAEKIAYVELGEPEGRRVGFGS